MTVPVPVTKERNAVDRLDVTPDPVETARSLITRRFYALMDRGVGCRERVDREFIEELETAGLQIVWKGEKE